MDIPTHLSLLPGGTEAIRQKWKLNNIHDFILFVANSCNITKDEAKQKINTSPELLKIAFCIA